MQVNRKLSAVILAADSLPTNGKQVGPRCLTETVGFTSVLERQVKVLSLFGIKKR